MRFLCSGEHTMSSDDKFYSQNGYRVRHAYKKARKSHPVCVLCGVKRRKISSGWEYWKPNEKRWCINNPPCIKHEDLLITKLTNVLMVSKKRLRNRQLLAAARIKDYRRGEDAIYTMVQRRMIRIAPDSVIEWIATDPFDDRRVTPDLVVTGDTVVTGDAVFEAPTRSRVTIDMGSLLKFVKPTDSARDEASYELGTLWIWSRSETEHLLMQASHVKHVHRVHAIFWSAVAVDAVRKHIEDGFKNTSLATYRMWRDAGVLPPSAKL